MSHKLSDFTTSLSKLSLFNWITDVSFEKNWIEIDKYLSGITTLSETEKDDIKLLAKIKENQILKLFRKKISINDLKSNIII